jgi:hypothetical protein
MNVTDKLSEVLIALAENCLVASLKQVAGLSVLAIVILAVGCQQPLHDSADGVLLSLDQQMNVIGHEAVGVEVEREPGFLMSELNEESVVIIVGTEDELAVIAASDDVIEPALDLDSRFAHRDRSLPRQSLLVN